MLGSFSSSSMDSMQGDFAQYLSVVESGPWATADMLKEMIPDFSGWNLSSMFPNSSFNFDYEQSVENLHEK